MLRFFNSIILTVSFLSTAHLQAQSCPGGVPNSGYDIIVIAGQSNAVGAGELNGSQSYHENTRFLQYDNKIFQLGRYEANDLNVISIQDYPRLQHIPAGGNSQRVHPDRYGFGLPFARRYATNSLCGNRKVLLVPVAKGSTSIYYWDNAINNFRSYYQTINGVRTLQHLDDSTYLYTDMLTRISHSLNQGGSRLVAFIWQQGEADILTMSGGAKWQLKGFYSSTTGYDSEKHRKGYRKRLFELHDNVRSLFDHGASSNFIFFIGEPSTEIDNISAPKALARRQLTEIMIEASSRHPYTYSVHSRFLQTNADLVQNTGSARTASDYLHFSAYGQRQLGARYYKFFNQLAP